MLSIQPPQPEIVQVSDKIQLMENILDKADVLRVGWKKLGELVSQRLFSQPIIANCCPSMICNIIDWPAAWAKDGIFLLNQLPGKAHRSQSVFVKIKVQGWWQGRLLERIECIELHHFSKNDHPGTFDTLNLLFWPADHSVACNHATSEPPLCSVTILVWQVEGLFSLSFNKGTLLCAFD